VPFDADRCHQMGAARLDKTAAFAASNLHTASNGSKHQSRTPGRFIRLLVDDPRTDAARARRTRRPSQATVGGVRPSVRVPARRMVISRGSRSSGRIGTLPYRAPRGTCQGKLRDWSPAKLLTRGIVGVRYARPRSPCGWCGAPDSAFCSSYGFKCRVHVEDERSWPARYTVSA
jgi:hypothetical protein